MPIEITMPRLSDTMEQGTVVKWNVKEGDTVSSGDVLADIETDKATMELESFDDGTIARLAAAEGEQVAVGAVIAIIAEEGEDASAAASSAGAVAPAAKTESGSDTAAPTATATEAAPSVPAPITAGSNGHSANGDRVFASPLARKIAGERGINLAEVTGSGPSGRIIKKDVENFTGSGVPSAAATSAPAGAPAPAPLPPAGATLESRVEPLTNMRATIARRLVESTQTIPHYVVTVSARLDNLLDLREKLNDQLAGMTPEGSRPPKLSVNDFLVRACALAMHQHPHVNSSWDDNGPSIRVHGQVNVGVAIALPPERGGGLVVATLRDADRRGLRDLSDETKRLAKKARDKGLTIEEMSDSTFTISNLGMFGVDHFTAIINPPNAAILAVGRAEEKPFITKDEDGEPAIEIGHSMAMTISSDHRIIDGAMAAAYLNTVRELLESPAALLV